MSPRSDDTADAPAVEGDIQDIVVIMEELQHQLRQAREANRTLQNEFEQEKARCAGLQKLADTRAEELERVKGSVAGLQEEGERLLIDLGITNEERIDTAREIRRLREQLDNAQGESRALKNQIRELREAAEVSQSATTDRLHSVEQNMMQLQDRIQGLEEQLEQRGHDLSEARSTILALRDENQQLERQVASLEHCKGDLEKVRSLMQAFALSDVEQ